MAYVHVHFPKRIFRFEQPDIVVNSQEELDEVIGEWFERPDDVKPPAPLADDSAEQLEPIELGGESPPKKRK